MLLTLIRKEVVSHVLSLRFGVTFLLFILLVFASLFVTTQEYQRDKAQFHASQRNAAAQLDEILKEDDPERRVERLFEDEGILDAVPVPPLASVSRGLMTIMPPAVNTTAMGVRSVDVEAGHNPLTGLLRAPDLVYVVSVVLSLLAILFAFDSICGEKESGTLRLMLSNAVPRDLVLLGKWIGGYVVLVVPFLIAAVGGLGYAWWRGTLELTGETPARIACLLGVACLYISVFFTLSMAISSFTHRAATSLFVCLLVWTVWILVIPNLAPVISKIAMPTPSIDKVNAEKQAVDDEIRLRVGRLSLVSGEVMYGKKIQREIDKLNQEGERRKLQWDRFLAESTRRQTRLAQTLGRLSPSVCWTYCAVSLMDTGPSLYQRLDEAVGRLRRDMTEYGQMHERSWHATGKFPEMVAEQVPHLQMPQQNFKDAFSLALTDVLILAVLNVVFFMAAFLLFLRYDVR